MTTIPSIKWRMATGSDLDTIICLSTEGVARTSTYMNRTELIRYCYRTLIPRLTADLRYTYVLADSNHVYATVVVCEGWVRWFAVAPKHWREGFGCEAIEFAESLGALRLYANESDLPTLGLLKDMGWGKVHRSGTQLTYRKISI